MFRTEVNVAPTALDLTLKDGVVTIGSCFAEVIGNKLQENKVPVLVNPFGTIFNPVSLASLLEATTGTQYNPEQRLVQRDKVWYNYDLHSSLSSPDKHELLTLIEQRITQTAAHIKKTRLLIITLGTAVGYELAETGAVVANCHKLPARLFQKNLISTEKITEALGVVFQRLQELNPALQIVLTVSPVRHVKETLQLNGVSKSILRIASHSLSEKYGFVHYFPAFELMVDDLRDYRFYGADMLHPTPVAEDYIWKKFISAYYHTTFQEYTKEWTKMKRTLAHKPFHPDTPAHQAFLQNTIRQLELLQEKYNLEITEEREALLNQIIH